MGKGLYGKNERGDWLCGSGGAYEFFFILVYFICLFSRGLREREEEEEEGLCACVWVVDR